MARGTTPPRNNQTRKRGSTSSTRVTSNYSANRNYNSAGSKRLEKPSTRRKTKKFDRKMQANLLLVFCIVIILFFVVIGRIWFITKNDKEKYEKKVLSQQTYVSNEIPYQRGSIVDRNDTVFAKSVKVYNLVIDCYQLLDKETYREPTINALIEAFGSYEEVSRESLNKLLAESPESKYNVILKQLSYEEKEAFEEIKEAAKKENNKKDLIKGVWFEEEYKRIYPLNTVACDIIGFTQKSGGQGVIGLENYYNSQLSGTTGREYGYFNANLELERTVKPAVNGNTLVTTLDANIQSIVEKQIEKFNQEIGSKNTAVLVMNPSNGEIYAMASEQPFDLNNPFDLTSFYTKQEIKAMTEEEKTVALNKIWRNFCISDAFEPGSTFKPITIAACLEEGIVKDSDTFQCTGYKQVLDRKMRCNAIYGHNTISLKTTLMKSCNVAMMEMSKNLGREKFYQYHTDFNFGAKTGIDLSGEAVGLIYSEEKLNPVELAATSFGQGFTCTMLQLAYADASIINGGYYYQPHVVKAIRNENGAIVKNIEPVVVRQTVSAKTSQLIREYMYDTVASDDGTASHARVEGYEIGGKTGTAEKLPRGNKKYLVSFIGFTPIEKPEVMIYVIIDEPNVEDQSRGGYAQILSADIMKEILPFLNVYSSIDNNITSDNDSKSLDLPDGTQIPTETLKPGETQSPSETLKPDETLAPDHTKEPNQTQDPDSTNVPEDEPFSFFDEGANDDKSLNENVIGTEPPTENIPPNLP